MNGIRYLKTAKIGRGGSSEVFRVVAPDSQVGGYFRFLECRFGFGPVWSLVWALGSVFGSVFCLVCFGWFFVRFRFRFGSDLVRFRSGLCAARSTLFWLESKKVIDEKKV